MMLEVLFARTAQGETFLLMVACGLILGAAVHLAGALHLKWKPLGMVADVLCAAGAVLAALMVILYTGTGLRLYALLGLLIGGTLYAGGIAPVISALRRRLPAHQKNNPRP